MNPPIHATHSPAEPLASKNEWARATMKTPAVTIVAAWMRAETGVGPSIASGSHTCNGNCALLPIAPRRRRSAMAVTVPFASVCARGNVRA